MAKFHYRFPPCPSYDIEGIESWLSALAEKGLFLDPEGYVFGLFQFQRGTPKKTKYRLEPIAYRSAVYIQNTEDPDQEALVLNEEFGWEYLGQFRDFYIYRSTDPNAREMNTDPVVQAMALDSVKKRNLFFLLLVVIQAASMILGFFGVPNSLRFFTDGEAPERFARVSVLCICIPTAVLLFRKEKSKQSESAARAAVLVLLVYLNAVSYLFADATTPLLDILDEGALWWILMAALIVSCLIAALISYLHICLLQRRLLGGEPLDRQKNWRKGRFLRMLPAVLPFLLLLAIPFARHSGGRSDASIPIGEFTQEVPFITMTDLAPDREYTPVTRNGGNTVRFWSDILSPVNYDWQEDAWLDAPDGSRCGGSLSITYHEAASEAIAKRLVTEYAGANQPDASLIPDGIDPSGFDFLGIYSGIHPSILIRKGNIVISAYCSVQSWGDHETLYPVWLEQMADRLQ